MVQLQNPARLNLKMTLGAQTTEFNSVGVPVPTFTPLAKIHAGRWNRSMIQSYAIAGTAAEDTDVYVIRHRKSYEGVTRVLIGDVSYELVDVQLDPIPGPMAYDLLTVRKVKKRG